MKRWMAALMLAVLLAGMALAEDVPAVNAEVKRLGFTAMDSENTAGVVGCWFTESAEGDILSWSDESRVYTVQTQPGAGLREAYARILGMCEWSTCAYTVGGRALYAFNAPNLGASRHYKTLKNYIQNVGKYIESRKGVSPTAAPSGYVLNTNTKRFHRPDCSSVPQIKASNRSDYEGDRQSLMEMGYVPCQVCKP